MNVKGKKYAVNPAVWLAGLAVLFLLILSVRKELQESETSFGDVIKQNVVQDFCDSFIERFIPVISFVGKGDNAGQYLPERQISELLSVYGYLSKEQSVMSETGNEESYLSLEDVLVADISGETKEPGETEKTEEIEAADDTEIAPGEPVMEKESQTTFVRHQLQNTVDLQALANYETLVQNFYTIDGNTMVGSDQLNASKLMEKDMRISKEADGPQILIYHTHSQEAFSDSIPGDVNTSIVGVGARLAEILQTEYGYKVLHHTGQYDVETRDDAYSYSLPAIEQLLAENPSIQVIIDLHRDAMPEETKLVMDLDGRPTARFMFFNGLSRTRKTGNIDYLYNENLDDNLAFSFQLQLKATEYYPGLSRKIYLKGYRYNLHLRPRTTLIELGAQNNTVEEAMNACDPLAHILDLVLSGGQ